MILKEVYEDILKLQALLPLGKSISFTEAERRAGEFLLGMAKITDAKHGLSERKINALSIQTVVYADTLQKGQSKTMTENKIYAEANREYIEVREALESIENDISYLKSYFDIFNNAHIFYRNAAKGE